MGCVLAFLYRLALLFVWVLTPLVNQAYDGGWILPLVGITFLPLTTLVYVVVYAVGNGVTGWEWLLVAVAFFVDAATYTADAQANRRRIPGYSAS